MLETYCPLERGRRVFQRCCGMALKLAQSSRWALCLENDVFVVSPGVAKETGLLYVKPTASPSDGSKLDTLGDVLELERSIHGLVLTKTELKVKKCFPPRLPPRPFIFCLKQRVKI